MDFTQLKAVLHGQAADLLTRIFPAGRCTSKYFFLGSVHGEKGKSLEYNLARNLWIDRATDEGGDIISLCAAHWWVSQIEAATRLQEMVGGADYVAKAPPAKKAKPVEPDYKQLIPPQDNIPDWKQHHHFYFGKPDRSFPYYTTDKKLIGWIFRWNVKNDKGQITKETRPYTYGELNGKTGWHYRGFNRPHPLFMLPTISIDKTIIMTEGEKDALALARAIDRTKYAVTCWPFGCGAYDKVDFSPLTGCNVILWPDNDAGGIKAMDAVAYLIRPIVKSVRVMRPLGQTPEDGFGAADFTPHTTGDAMVELIMENIAREHEEAPQQENIPISAYKDNYQEDAPDSSPGTPDKAYKALGYAGENFFFFSYRTMQIVCLSRKEFGKSAFYVLSTKTYWEGMYHGKRGADYDKATDHLITECVQAGYFDVESVRGRGAWMEGKTAVINTGMELYVNSISTPYKDHSSKYVYAASQRIGTPLGHELSVEETNIFFSICEAINWAEDVSAYLFAGWCAIAPICGALTWRPHIWLTSEAGGGKTWVIDNILVPVLGPFSMKVSAGTTEAGIRQRLGNDARPIIFDEAEGENRDAKKHIEQSVALARQASSENGGMIIKGSTSHQAVQFSMRSCFCFASINPIISTLADEARISVLSIKKNNTEEGIKDFKENLRGPALSTLTPEFCAALRAKVIRKLPELKANTEIFAMAAASHFGSQRTGDQLGGFLAGAYLLKKDRPVSYEEALEFIGRNEWPEQKAVTSEEDPEKLMRTILSARLRLFLNNAHQERTVLELIRISIRGEEMEKKNSYEELLRNGIKVDLKEESIFISNTSKHIRKFLNDTSWESGWSRVLHRFSTARSPQNAIWFSDSGTSRAVEIKLSAINLGD